MNKGRVDPAQMNLLNFSHPLNGTQLAQICDLTGYETIILHELAVNFENGDSFLPQFRELAARISLSAHDIRSQVVPVNLPSLNCIAAMLLAELHGRMGHFPPIIRLRPVSGTPLQDYEVAEILNLNPIREQARAKRYG